MAYPAYVPTRMVTIGGAVGMENAQDLKVKVSIQASRSLVWDDTGYRFEQIGYDGTSGLGTELAIELITTDTAGWRDPVLQALVDVSAPNSYTHLYTAQVSFVDGSGRPVGNRVTIGPFSLPTGAGSLDLDKILPTDDVAGGVIYVPDTWDASIDAETARATVAENQLTLDLSAETTRATASAAAFSLVFGG